MILLPSSEFLHNYRRNLPAMFGSALLVIFVLMALFGPLIVGQNPYDVSQLELLDSFKPPAWLEGGENRYILGTDGQGRDVLALIVYGARISAFIGMTAMAFSCLIGTALGLLSGYFGGTLDSIIMRIADIQLSFPSMLIALFLMSAFGPGIVMVLIALTAVGWVVYARTVRGSTLSEIQKEYIQAARVAGLGNFQIIVRHVLPNVMTPLIVVSTFRWAHSFSLKPL